MKKIFNKFTIGGLILIVSILFIFSSFGGVAPKVVSTTPENNKEDVPETSEITITFNKSVNLKQKNNLKITTNPSLEFDLDWQDKNLRLIPKSPMLNYTSYSLSVLYKESKIYNFSFTTRPFDEESIKKFGPLQAKDDYDYGVALNNLIKKYPWYPYLPIKTSDYVIYYDFDNEEFAITFLKTPNQNQKDILIVEALDKLKEIGVKEPIRYYSRP